MYIVDFHLSDLELFFFFFFSRVDFVFQCLSLSLSMCPVQLTGFQPLPLPSSRPAMPMQMPVPMMMPVDTSLVAAIVREAKVRV